MSTFPSISIHITRSSDENKDDVIKIVQKHEGCFVVTYTDGGASQRPHCFESATAGVIDYLRTTMNLLANDEEPFHQVQFSLPAFPRIMVSVDKLSDEEFMESIYSAVGSICAGWPTFKEKAPVADEPFSLNYRYTINNTSPMRRTTSFNAINETH
jgi:hypothetical protein